MKIFPAAFSILVVVSSVGCQSTKSSESPTGPQTHGHQAKGRKATGNPQTVEEAKVKTAEFAKAARDKYRTMTFEEFKATVWREPEALGGKYLVNGDQTILNEKQLREFFENEVQKEPLTRGMQDSAKLVINLTGGLDDLWNTSMQRQLTYCVSSTFGSAHHDQVVQAMKDATEAWEKAANIDFIYTSSEDGNCTASNGGIVFDIRPVNVNGEYLARSFFPNEPRAARNILIDDTAFTTTGHLTLTGILRHELGHCLGFRHEHTRPEAGACFEDNDWRPVTDYDAFSVMHYPQCNGQGDWSLTLTNLDRNGAACVYGPADGFTMDPALHLQNCRTVTPSPCSPQTETLQGSVAKGQEKLFGPFAVTAGGTFAAVMTGTGDPDLYVRFDQAPTQQFYDCRPYLSGASESCSLDVPGGEDKAFLMVRGYTAATFTLTVTHANTTP